MSDSQILSPSQTIVNIEAVGGSQEARDNTAVDAATTSKVSLVVASIISYFHVCVEGYF